MKTWEVYSTLPHGKVDWLGTVTAETKQAALVQAYVQFTIADDEKVEVQEKEGKK